MEHYSSIFPVYRGSRYLYHICGKCNGAIHLEVRYNKDLNFCPLCGTQIIQSHAKPIDIQPLEIFVDLQLEYERKARWLYYCYISKEHRNKIDDLMAFVNQDDNMPEIYKKAVSRIRSVQGLQLRAWALKRLRKEFGNNQEQGE